MANDSSYLNIYKADYAYWNDVLHEDERIPVDQHFALLQVLVETKGLCYVGRWKCHVGAVVFYLVSLV